MSRSTKFIMFALVAIVVLLGGQGAKRALLASAHPDLSAIPASALQRLFALELPDSEQQLHDFAQWRGRPLVINFWATWCPPCRHEMPELVALNKRYAADGVQFVGLSIDTADKVRAFADELGIDYPLLIAGHSSLQLSAEFGNTARALPFTLVIDGNGEVRFVKLGMLQGDALERTIRALLPASGTADAALSAAG